jgi:3-oxoacyl-[acyl-carrier protein] reductase
MDLKDQVVLVTGAGSGFGEAIARSFSAQGALVGLLDLRLEAAERVAGDLPKGRALALQTDVSNGSAVQACVAAITKRWQSPSIVVNNAGFTHKNRSCLEVDEATFDRIFDVNVKSIFHVVHAVVPAMRDHGGGVIINIGSTAGTRPRPGLSWYNASKGAVATLSKSLAVELAPWKIRVNCICPVMSITGMFQDFIGGEDTPEVRAKFLSSIPLGRFCEPDDVAQAALYLARSEFITGIDLPVDGGRTI